MGVILDPVEKDERLSIGDWLISAIAHHPIYQDFSVNDMKHKGWTQSCKQDVKRY